MRNKLWNNLWSIYSIAFTRKVSLLTYNTSLSAWKRLMLRNAHTSTTPAARDAHPYSILSSPQVLLLLSGGRESTTKKGREFVVEGVHFP